MRYEEAFTPPKGVDFESGPVQPVSPNVPGLPPNNSEQPDFNPLLRSPLPLTSASPDSLRQYYRSGVPQNRIWPIS